MLQSPCGANGPNWRLRCVTFDWQSEHNADARRVTEHSDVEHLRQIKTHHGIPTATLLPLLLLILTSSFVSLAQTHAHTKLQCTKDTNDSKYSDPARYWHSLTGELCDTNNVTVLRVRWTFRLTVPRLVSGDNTIKAHAVTQLTFWSEN